MASDMSDVCREKVNMFVIQQFIYADQTHGGGGRGGREGGEMVVNAKGLWFQSPDAAMNVQSL